MSSPRSPDELEARRLALVTELGEAVTLDSLTGTFTIFQRRRGHRHSTDDLLTAWYAVVHAQALSPRRLLDLGSGIGSVGLAVLSCFGEATLTAVEVQAVSFRLLTENVWANGVAERVQTIHGDLRTSVPAERFDLVTGSPPYFDVRTGIVSQDSQRAAARFELHGDVRDYCVAARRALAPGGRFVFCFPTAQRERAERAAMDAGLGFVATRDVIPREGIAPLFSLFVCADGAANADALPPDIPRDAPHTVRDREGEPTAEHLAARAVFDLR